MDGTRAHMINLEIVRCGHEGREEPSISTANAEQQLMDEIYALRSPSSSAKAAARVVGLVLQHAQQPHASLELVCSAALACAQQGEYLAFPH